MARDGDCASGDWLRCVKEEERLRAVLARGMRLRKKRMFRRICCSCLCGQDKFYGRQKEADLKTNKGLPRHESI